MVRVKNRFAGICHRLYYKYIIKFPWQNFEQFSMDKSWRANSNRFAMAHELMRVFAMVCFSHGK